METIKMEAKTDFAEKNQQEIPQTLKKKKKNF